VKKVTTQSKKPGSSKNPLKRLRIYLLLVALVIVIGVVVVVVASLNNKKTPPAPSVSSQTLTPSELKQSQSPDTTIGSSNQTLNIQGNATFTGQGVIHGSLNVAGTIQSGGQLALPQIKVAGNTTLASAQIGNLQVATSAAFNGLVTAQSGVNVAGSISFITLNAASLTDTSLVLSSNAQIQGHVSFAPPTNATPYRQISFGVLGNGGSGSVFGSDTSGTVAVNTGNNPLPGCFVTVIFNVPYTTMPNVLISPINIGAGKTKYYLLTTTKSFKICTTVAAPPNQAFAFDYFAGATPDS
jgi:hypothetical protein